jgi:thiamine-monophosphate kinase
MSSSGSDPKLVGHTAESELLARILPRFRAADAALVGPGDDAAVVRAPDGRFVVTTDLMVHGPDFRMAWSTPFELGWKAAASNLSDVAAMGARPTALVVALAATADLPVEFLEQLADGIREGCAAMAPGCGVVGGDLSVSATLTIAVTAFGDLEGREPTLRSGARAGDVLAVAGSMGRAAQGLDLLFRRGVDADGRPDVEATARLRAEYPDLIRAQTAPHPPIGHGVIASKAGATAMMDVSDGLLLDASRLAAASGVRLDISGAALEPHGRFALRGGEDHSLLAAFPTEDAVPEGFTVIGRVLPGHGVSLDGADLDPHGWDPYSSWSGAQG